MVGIRGEKVPRLRDVSPLLRLVVPAVLHGGKKPRPSVVVIATNMAMVNASASSEMVIEGPPAPPVSTLVDSTDPARSLSDVFDAPVGPEPTRVREKSEL